MASQNDRATSPDLHHAWAVATEILGGSQGAMAVLADNPAQARELEKQLQTRWDTAPANAKPFVAVHSLWDLAGAGRAGREVRWRSPSAIGSRRRTIAGSSPRRTGQS